MPQSAFEHVAQALDPPHRLVRAWPLVGGVSAQVTALEVEYAGTLQTVVVRQHGAVDLARNPLIATTEFRLLRLLQAAGIAVPTPYLVDQSGQILASPYLVVEYVDGAAEIDPAALPACLEQMAQQLAHIHQIDSTTVDLTFLPPQAGLTEALLVQAASEDIQLAACIQTLNQSNHTSSVLVHGDFWPGNLLWKHGQLVAIIDWEDAAVGAPLSDVANTRLELLWAYGHEAMEQFTAAYRAFASHLDWSLLAAWDVWAALRRSPATIATWNNDPMRTDSLLATRRWFIHQALANLAI